jgi:hypothetical protein
MARSRWRIHESYLPAGVAPPYVLGLLLGIGSGAAMAPYTVIKEVNADNVKGSASGAINFLVFAFKRVARARIRQAARPPRERRRNEPAGVPRSRLVAARWHRARNGACDVHARDRTARTRERMRLHIRASV